MIRKKITGFLLPVLLPIFLTGCVTQADIARMTPQERQAYYAKQAEEEAGRRQMAAIFGAMMIAKSQERPAPAPIIYPAHSTCHQYGTFYDCNYY